MQRYRNLLTFIFSDYRRVRYLTALLLGPFLFYCLQMAVSWVLLGGVSSGREYACTPRGCRSIDDAIFATSAVFGIGCAYLFFKTVKHYLEWPARLVRTPPPRCAEPH